MFQSTRLSVLAHLRARSSVTLAPHSLCTQEAHSTHTLSEDPHWSLTTVRHRRRVPGDTAEQPHCYGLRTAHLPEARAILTSALFGTCPVGVLSQEAELNPHWYRGLTTRIYGGLRPLVTWIRTNHFLELSQWVKSKPAGASCCTVANSKVGWQNQASRALRRRRCHQSSPLPWLSCSNQEGSRSTEGRNGKD